jgi:hypothetical protein
MRLLKDCQTPWHRLRGKRRSAKAVTRAREISGDGQKKPQKQTDQVDGVDVDVTTCGGGGGEEQPHPKYFVSPKTQYISFSFSYAICF